LLNDKYKLESLQGDGSRTRQEIPQTAGCKARASNCSLHYRGTERASNPKIASVIQSFNKTEPMVTPHVFYRHGF